MCFNHSLVFSPLSFLQQVFAGSLVRIWLHLHYNSLFSSWLQWLRPPLKNDSFSCSFCWKKAFIFWYADRCIETCLDLTVLTRLRLSLNVRFLFFSWPAQHAWALKWVKFWALVHMSWFHTYCEWQGSPPHCQGVPPYLWGWQYYLISTISFPLSFLIA